MNLVSKICQRRSPFIKPGNQPKPPIIMLPKCLVDRILQSSRYLIISSVGQSYGPVNHNKFSVTFKVISIKNTNKEILSLNDYIE